MPIIYSKELNWVKPSGSQKTVKVKISLVKKFNFRMDFDHMFEERILQLKTQMTMFTLVFIDIFDSMYFGFVSFQNKSVAHFLTTFVTFDSSVNLMYMSFQKTWSSKTSGTLFTVKWGHFFIIFHHVFFQVLNFHWRWRWWDQIFYTLSGQLKSKSL